MQTILDDAIEQYRRDKFFRAVDEGFARLQVDPEAWNEELSGRRLWDTTLLDGLEEDGLEEDALDRE